MNTTGSNQPIQILSKKFAAHESFVINIVEFDFKNTLKSLSIKSSTGLMADFLWQRNESYESKGYFKEIKNDLGATIAHHKGVLAITNGGIQQDLEINLNNVTVFK
ncbi:hypothetical protein VUJ46_15940 [Chryseobacterium sp. MYb264]|uniref:hypothetical protein n=1 Tax=Chryseobacterium sp. MYb264 TaxID=2745153 RepID=UPI002E0EC92D|nr:hypothetical protein VUJ46_15940 [Chryseobacterium sp. MYb264]